ncbi:MAG: hypothetical protein IT210_25920 [Armatimonadetes bacterium]|nr:hypothetical protein [Armatimonadota bacterium]
MSVRVAVVQQEIVPGRVEVSRRKALRFAEQALSQEADIILFPEEALIGHTPDLRDLAEPLDGPTPALSSGCCATRAPLRPTA